MIKGDYYHCNGGTEQETWIAYIVAQYVYVLNHELAGEHKWQRALREYDTGMQVDCGNGLSIKRSWF